MSQSALQQAASRVCTNIEIQLNGLPRAVPTGQTVAELLVALELAGRPVAVEVNQELVPRAGHASRQLAAGDVVEIVTLVGGG